MLEIRKKENESPASLLYRFSKRVKRSGLLKEMKRRKFHSRPLNKRKIRESALHREAKRKEIEQERKMGKL